MKNPQLSPAQRQERDAYFSHLYWAGWSIRRIGSETGWSYGTVHRALGIQRVTFRSRGHRSNTTN
jgi:hypothetical protein